MIPRVIAGEKLRTQPLNKTVDAVNTILSGPGMGPAVGAQAGTRVFVINKTGRELLHGEAAPYSINSDEPYDPPAMPYDSPQRMLQGTVVTLRDPVEYEDWTNWIVLGQRIPDGRSGWGYDSGVLLARIKYAAPDESEFHYKCCELFIGEDWWHLTRVPVGPARILWFSEEDPEGSGAEQYVWALIRLGGHDQYPQLYKITDEEEYGKVKARRVNINDDLVGEKEQFWVVET